jgi:hypothetical protein
MKALVNSLRSIPLLVGLALAITHTMICFAVEFRLVESEGSWGWFLVFLIDLPFSIIILPVQKVLPPLIAFGTMGFIWWFFIGWLISKIVQRIYISRSNREPRSDR